MQKKQKNQQKNLKNGGGEKLFIFCMNLIFSKYGIYNYQYNIWKRVFTVLIYWVKETNFSPRIAFPCISWCLLYIVRMLRAWFQFLTGLRRWKCKLWQKEPLYPDNFHKWGTWLAFWCISWVPHYQGSSNAVLWFIVESSNWINVTV